MVSSNRCLRITIPTLSNVTSPQVSPILPEFCVIKLSFDISGFVQNVDVINYLILDDMIIKVM